VIRLLVPHVIRAVPWWPFAAAAVLAVVAQVPALRSNPDPRWVLTGLRLAAAVLGAAAGFALPDLMAATVITPMARWRRQWLRLAVLLLPAILVWSSIYVVVRAMVGPALSWPAGFVILQAAVCGLLPLAAAAVGARYRNSAAGALPGPVTQGVAVVLTLFLTERASPWPVPVSAEWTTAQRGWPVALALVLLTLLIANRETTRPGSA
jgi:uncharacterized integral membrane protein